MIQFNCPQCGKPISVNDDAAGKRGKCRACGQLITIPDGKAIEGVSRPQRPKEQPDQQLVPSKTNPPKQVAPAPVPLQPLPHEVPQPHLVESRPTPPVAVQVNIQPAQAAHSLGIASLVLGILSFFVCWLPFVGFGFGGLGLLLGTAGLVLAITRQGTGIGYSIAGTAVNSVAVFIGITFMTGFFGAFSALQDAAKQTPVLAEPVAGHSGEAQPAGASVGTNDVAGTNTFASPTPEKEPGWMPASQPLMAGDVQLEITEVVAGHVPLKSSFSDSDGESEDRLLLVRLNITNTSQRKKIDYQGWMSNYASLLDIDAELTDDAGNRYRKIRFASLSKVKDAESDASLYPGKSINDAIVFELPIEGVQYLRLKLSGKGFGEDAEFRFHIPGAMIQSR